MDRQLDGWNRQIDGLTNAQIERTDKCTDRRQTEWCTEWKASVNKDEDTKGCIFKTTVNCVCQNNQSDYVMLWV